jgi:hypothetical protein
VQGSKSFETEGRTIVIATKAVSHPPNNSSQLTSNSSTYTPPHLNSAMVVTAPVDLQQANHADPSQSPLGAANASEPKQPTSDPEGNINSTETHLTGPAADATTNEPMSSAPQTQLPREQNTHKRLSSRILSSCKLRRRDRVNSQGFVARKGSLYGRFRKKLRGVYFGFNDYCAWRRPWPRNPKFRFLGYDPFAPSVGKRPEGIPLRIGRVFRPSLCKARTEVPYWRADYPALTQLEIKFWNGQLGQMGSELTQHFHKIRENAWQIVPEFSHARWWFLRSVLIYNPYYSEILESATAGATIVDLASGLGQELRWLRHDGAIGDMYAVDVHPQMWELGLSLFKNPSPKAIAFREIDLIDYHARDRNQLHEFANTVDIYLLNDFLSFLGPIVIEYILMSIANASRVGTKVIGWAIGQEGDESTGMRVWGDGSRGVIHNLTTFQAPWRIMEAHTHTKWQVEAQLVKFEQLGFDQEDCEWFESSFFEGSLCGKPMPLRGLCFLATRVE